MTGQIHTAPQDIAPLLGDPHPLLERLGSAVDVAAPAPDMALAPLGRIQSVPALRAFLQSYQTELLVPVELPAILRAYNHALRNEARELVALDRQMATEPALREFAAASCRVGQRQLNRLRPLRDLRLVQRYRAAIGRGEAHGWHTLVYGISLGVFSLPLRQGLVAYAGHTMGGFIQHAARPLALTAGQCATLHERACAGVPELVQSLLFADGRLALRVV
jgi:urease accessory protein UreF